MSEFYRLFSFGGKLSVDFHVNFFTNLFALVIYLDNIIDAQHYNYCNLFFTDSKSVLLGMATSLTSSYLTNSLPSDPSVNGLIFWGAWTPRGWVLREIIRILPFSTSYETATENP